MPHPRIFAKKRKKVGNRSALAAGRGGIAYGENSLALKHSPLRSPATSCGPIILPLNY
jgi:hypothetical protein